MGADRPDDGEMPPDEHPDRPPDRNENGSRPGGFGSSPAETRSYQEYYVELRVAESAQKSTVARQASSEEQAAAEKWEEKKGESREMWGEHQRKWPPEERPPAVRPDSDMDNAAKDKLAEEYERIAVRERDIISPRLREIESCDPDRYLAGFEFRLKERDRIQEKVAKNVAEKGHSLEQAISKIPDIIRFTLQYPESHYTEGVWADIGRLEGQGFEAHTRKSFWEDDQYKGINSQWIHPESGQRFEVQFHTRISFEAKQLTHPAYELLRTGQPDRFEHMVLEAFQRKVTADVPVPPGAADIPDYPERRADAG